MTQPVRRRRPLAMPLPPREWDVADRGDAVEPSGGANRFGDGACQRLGSDATGQRQGQRASGSSGCGVSRGGEREDYVAVEGGMDGTNRQR